jgi:phosphatidate cytidylyltransferase
MLRYRLIFGTLMTVLFVSIVIFDGKLDGCICNNVQATLLTALLILVAVPAQLEIAKLIRKIGAKVFTIVIITASILLSTWPYWSQFASDSYHFRFTYQPLVLAFSLPALFIYQAIRYGNKSVIVNCGVNLFAIIYLGFLSSFILAVRIDFGLWPLLMFIFTVKSSDIGAYIAGKLFGTHKFSPTISPGKTWEGMAGAGVFAAVVGSIFAVSCDIISGWIGAVFGVIFAFLGQLGDLAESMIKRDAQQKDSANSLPGFGGILDVIDSPLATAPFAYLFFIFAVGI